MAGADRQFRTKQKRSPKPAKTGLSEARLLVRVKFADGLQLGSGKIELLERIDATGSISAAARDMEMSYRRARLLVEELAQMFKRPVVTRAAGGQKRRWGRSYGVPSGAYRVVPAA